MLKIERKDHPETRHLEIPLQLKLAGTGGDMTFSGYGAVFDNVDAYGDMIVKGAFAETIAYAKSSGQWPAMLMQHGGWGIGADDMTPVGIWTSLEEDGIGLKVEGKLADTARGKEAYALMKMDPRPAINGLSIGYVVKSYEPRSRPEEPRRKLTKIDLMEVSLVTFPANPKARVANVKSTSITHAERALRDAGFSRAQAKEILAKGWHDSSLRDAGDDELEQLAERIRRNTQIITA